MPNDSSGVENDAQISQRGVFRRILPDLTPWRSSRDFRLVWSSGTITMIGSVFALIALPLQVKELTGSMFAVGAMGLAELVPTIVFGLYGGALADAMDRRRVVFRTEIGLGLLSLFLLANSLLDRPLLWPLYLVAAGVAALQGLQGPSLEAMVPRLVPHDQIPAALALNSVRGTVAVLIGPAIAGFVVASAGISASYAVDTASFVLSVLLLAGVRPIPVKAEVERPSLRGIGEGIRYACGRPELLGTYLADLVATVLAVPIVLFPFLADELHARWALGLLYTATGAGSLLATVTSGWTARVHRHGRMVLFAAVALGAAMFGLGFAHQLWLVLGLLVLAGAANFVGDLFRGTLWNQSIPDRLRGRLAGVELLIGSSGPQLGDVRAGAVGARFGLRASIWSGGVGCAAAAVALAVTLPALWRYDARTDPHAAEVRRMAG